MPRITMLALFVFFPLAFAGCAMTSWPAKVYRNPNLPLSNYSTFSFALPVTANIMEDQARDKIIKLLEKNGYRYLEDKESADFIADEKFLWEEKVGYTPARVEYTPLYTQTSVIYIPRYFPERPYTYYDFSASVTFYDRVSQEKIYEGKTEGSASSLDPEEIFQAIIKQSNLPISLGKPKTPPKESYKVYTTKFSKIYHRAGCPELGTEELIEFKNPEEAQEAGGTPCQKCKP
ncbi:MAG TPA: DUF4136 domain-containing protein [Candidatus Hypogeohydataceae bacterium YC41]